MGSPNSALRQNINRLEITAFCSLSADTLARVWVRFVTKSVPLGAAFVEIKYNDSAREIKAQTLGCHVLVGTRNWNVLVSGNSIIVSTYALERRLDPVINAGFMLRGNGPKQTVNVWEQYFKNIVKERVGAGWKVEMGQGLSEFREAPGGEGTVENWMRRKYWPESFW